MHELLIRTSIRTQTNRVCTAIRPMIFPRSHGGSLTGTRMKTLITRALVMYTIVPRTYAYKEHRGRLGFLLCLAKIRNSDLDDVKKPRVHK